MSGNSLLPITNQFFNKALGIAINLTVKFYSDTD